jgi:hypothetical protein
MQSNWWNVWTIIEEGGLGLTTTPVEKIAMRQGSIISALPRSVFRELFRLEGNARVNDDVAEVREDVAN